MTNTTTNTTAPIAITAPFAFYDANNVLNDYQRGEVIYDPAEIADLIARGVPHETAGAEPMLSRQRAYGRPLALLERDLKAAAYALKYHRGVPVATPWAHSKTRPSGRRRGFGRLHECLRIAR